MVVIACSVAVLCMHNHEEDNKVKSSPTGTIIYPWSTTKTWKREAISVGGGPYGDAETRGGGAATTPVGQQQRPTPFDGKLAWDAYRTQFELLVMMNRWSNAEKAAYLAISLRGNSAD